MVADGALVGAHGWLRLTLGQDPEVLSAAVRELAEVVGRVTRRRRVITPHRLRPRPGRR